MEKLRMGDSNNSNPSLKGIKLLAVDDNIDCRDFLAMLFQLYQADAKVVSTASQAFDLLLQFQPQILVIDLAMPVVDGFGLLESIHRIETKQSRSSTPAIAITAIATEIVCQKSYQAGYRAIFPKPIDIDAFIDTIVYLTESTSTCH